MGAATSIRGLLGEAHEGVFEFVTDVPPWTLDDTRMTICPTTFCILEIRDPDIAALGLAPGKATLLAVGGVSVGGKESLTELFIAKKGAEGRRFRTLKFSVALENLTGLVLWLFNPKAQPWHRHGTLPATSKAGAVKKASESTREKKQAAIMAQEASQSQKDSGSEYNCIQGEIAKYIADGGTNSTYWKQGDKPVVKLKTTAPSKQDSASPHAAMINPDGKKGFL